jgi:tetratricopeptide (TPR) repeat protein
MIRRTVLLAAVSALMLSAAPAFAQKDQFAAAVRELAGAVLGTDRASRSAGVKAAADRMAAALAQWDRTISAIDARVTSDLQTTTGRRAYELHFELAVLYLERGRIADALRHLEHASSVEPDSADSLLLRATALERSGKTDAAAKRWLAVWHADRNNPAKAYQLLRSSGGTDADRAAAVSVIKGAYERLLATAEPPRSLVAGSLNVIPDTFAATPIVGDAATAEAFAHIAEARYDDALAALRRDAPPGEGALAHFNRGREHEQANRVREARREFEAAVAGTLAGRSLLYVGIGRLAQVEGDFAGAVDAFRRAVQLNPNDVNMHRELGLAYAAQGAVDEAFVELAASLLLNPRDAQTFADIGRLFLDAGRDGDALPPLYRALALAPERYETRYAIATGLTRIGRDDDAARELAAFQQAQRDALDRQRKGFAAPLR